MRQLRKPGEQAARHIVDVTAQRDDAALLAPETPLSVFGFR